MLPIPIDFKLKNKAGPSIIVPHQAGKDRRKSTT